MAIGENSITYILATTPMRYGITWEAGMDTGKKNKKSSVGEKIKRQDAGNGNGNQLARAL